MRTIKQNTDERLLLNVNMQGGLDLKLPRLASINSTVELLRTWRGMHPSAVQVPEVFICAASRNLQL